MADPDAETHELGSPQPKPATVEQMHRMNELVDGYAGLCEKCVPSDIWNELKKRYRFGSTADITAEIADKIIRQVEDWYNKKKAG